MKISNENKFTIYNETDFMNMINEFQDKYEEVYWNTIEGQVFVYRPLGRLEYKEVLNSDTTDIEKEDIVCKACLLYPENFDFDEWIGDYLNNELDSVYSDANVSRFLEDEICEVVKQHLIKSGLLMENK